MSQHPIASHLLVLTLTANCAQHHIMKMQFHYNSLCDNFILTSSFVLSDNSHKTSQCVTHIELSPLCLSAYCCRKWYSSDKMLPEWSQDSPGGTAEGKTRTHTYLCQWMYLILDINICNMYVCPPQTLMVKVCGVICSVVGGLAVGKVNVYYWDRNIFKCPELSLTSSLFPLQSL